MRRMLLAAALLLTGCASDQPTTREATATTAAATTTADTGFPEEGLPTTTKPPTGRHQVGDAITLEGTDTGQEVARVLVARVRFAGGDEYNKPERGLFLGVYVKVKALADDQSSLWGDFYVTMRGHHYDAGACCPDGFTPTPGLRRPPGGRDRRGMAAVRRPRPPRRGRPQAVLRRREDRTLAVLTVWELAARMGFEPMDALRRQRFSRRPNSLPRRPWPSLPALVTTDTGGWVES